MTVGSVRPDGKSRLDYLAGVQGTLALGEYIYKMLSPAARQLRPRQQVLGRSADTKGFFFAWYPQALLGSSARCVRPEHDGPR